MQVRQLRINLTRQGVRELGERMAKGYAAGTSTITEVAKHGRFRAVMPQLQAALDSKGLEAAKRVTRDTLTASRVTLQYGQNNVAYQFFEKTILPTAEKSPKLAQFLLSMTRRGANRHNMHSLFIRIKVLEKFGHTQKHLDEIHRYRWEFFECERQESARRAFKQHPKAKLPLALKTTLIQHPRDLNSYELNMSDALTAIWNRLHPDKPIAAIKRT